MPYNRGLFICCLSVVVQLCQPVSLFTHTVSYIHACMDLSVEWEVPCPWAFADPGSGWFGAQAKGGSPVCHRVSAGDQKLTCPRSRSDKAPSSVSQNTTHPGDVQESLLEQMLDWNSVCHHLAGTYSNSTEQSRSKLQLPSDTWRRQSGPSQSSPKQTMHYAINPWLAAVRPTHVVRTHTNKNPGSRNSGAFLYPGEVHPSER